MTTASICSIGLLSHESAPGDWAFEAALEMARQRRARLNVFSFVLSPFDLSMDVAPASLPKPTLEPAALVALDRALRERWEDRLGDFVDVGFRVCENVRHNRELRRCLARHEYQVLFIPYVRPGCSLGTMSIEESAYRFPAAVVLVGPDHARQFHLNPPAFLFAGETGMPAVQSAIAIKQPEHVRTTPSI